jgi:hypothetical protein
LNGFDGPGDELLADGVGEDDEGVGLAAGLEAGAETLGDGTAVVGATLGLPGAWLAVAAGRAGPAAPTLPACAYPARTPTMTPAAATNVAASITSRRMNLTDTIPSSPRKVLPPPAVPSSSAA